MGVRFCLSILLLAGSSPAQQSSSYVTTVAAGFVPWDQNPVSKHQFLNPTAVAYDAQGVLYYTDGDVVWRLNSDGSNTVLVQIPGAFAYITVLAIDSNRNLYMADLDNSVVWKATATGALSVFAGTGVASGPEIAGPAPGAHFYLMPSGIAIAPDGSAYVSDSFAGKIYKFSADGTDVTVAASPPTPPFGGVSYGLFWPNSLALIGNSLFIANSGSAQILEEDLTTGKITPAIGEGTTTVPSGPALCASPSSVETMAGSLQGTLFFAMDGQVCEFDPGQNLVRAYAGALDGSLLPAADGPALTVTIDPASIALDRTSGDMAIADAETGMIRIVRAATQSVESVAGKPQFFGNGGPAVLAPIPFRESLSGSLSADAAGNLYLVDGPYIQKVNAGGIIETIAGNGLLTGAGDGVPALQASLGAVYQIAVDPAGNNIFILEYSGRIRKIDKAGIITTIAGEGSAAPADGIPAIQTSIPFMSYIAADSPGNLFVSSGAYVWRLDVSGVLHQFAGGGNKGSFVENGVATQVIISPSAVAADGAGNVYFVNENSIARVDPSGHIHTLIGTPPATAFISPVTALAVDAKDNLYVYGLNPQAPAIQELSAAGVLSTVVETQIGDLASDPAGNLYYTGNCYCVYKLTPEATPAAPLIFQFGVVGAGGSVPPVTAVSPNALTSIYGSNFIAADTHRNVLGSDLVNGKLPTNLAGVCVSFGNAPAAILAIYPGQINVEAPSLPAGSSTVQVTINCGTPQAVSSNLGTVTVAPASPEFFSFAPNGTTGQNPIAALNATTGAAIGASNPAKPGDIIEAYGTGWGVTNPAIGLGVIPGAAAPLAIAPTLTLGGTTLAASDVLYAGAAPCCAGLFQVDFRVPAGIPGGNQTLLIDTGGYVSSFGAYLAVQGTH